LTSHHTKRPPPDPHEVRLKARLRMRRFATFIKEQDAAALADDVGPDLINLTPQVSRDIQRFFDDYIAALMRRRSS